MLNGHKNRNSQDERRLTDGFGGGDVSLVRVIVDDVDIHHIRHIVNVGDFVRRWRVRKQIALFGVAQFFHRHPTNALRQPADNLAAIDTGVDLLADIHENIQSFDFQITCKSVDQHLGDGAATGEVKKRIALTGGPIEINAASCVIATLSQTASFAISQDDEIRKLQSILRATIVKNFPILKDDALGITPQPDLFLGKIIGCAFSHVLFDLVTSIDGGTAVQIRAGPKPPSAKYCYSSLSTWPS